MPLRISLICAALLAHVSLVSAGQKEETHPVRPSEVLSTIARADKVVVYDDMPTVSLGGGSAPLAILYSSVSPKDISELRKSIVIEQPKGWFRCACIPQIDIILSRKGRELGAISVYEGLTIGFSAWSGDARIADQEKLLKWFDARGITGPRRSIKEQIAREKADRSASERWLKTMPASLRRLWPKLMNNPERWSDPAGAVLASANALQPLLTKEFPNMNQRIRWLFGWFGSGAGPWSGFPVYEDIASHLLLEYQPSDLMNTLQSSPLTESEMEGAARFFSGYTYGSLFRVPGDNTLIAHIPEGLKKSLLDHALRSPDPDNVDRARRALEQQ